MNKRSVAALLGVAALGLLMAGAGWALGGRGVMNHSLPGFIQELLRIPNTAASAQLETAAPSLAQETAEQETAAGDVAIEEGAAVETAAESADPQVPYHVLIDLGAAKVQLKQGSDFTVDAHGHDDAVQAVQDGNLYSVTASDSSAWEDLEVDITVPQGELEELFVQVGAGELTAKDLACRSATVVVGAGRVELQDFAVSESLDAQVNMGEFDLDGRIAGQITLSVDMGEIQMDVAQPEDYGYQVSCGMGSVTLGDDTFSGVNTQVSNNETASTLFAVNCGMGSVSVDF